MKKLLAVICALVLILALAGCGNSEDNASSSSKPQTSSRVIIDEDEDEDISSETSSKEIPVCEDLESYVVVGHKDAAAITSIYDIKDKKIGYVYSTDSEKIAKYIGKEENLLGFGPEGDAFSKMLDKSAIDYIIVTRDGAADRMSNRTDVVVALDKIEF